MIKIIIADDHAVVRGGLMQLFSLIDDIVVVGEAANGNELVDMVMEKTADLVVLDLTMPGLSGVNLITRLRSLRPETHILVLSMHDSWQVAKRTFQAGATGFVTKSSEQELLLAAIYKVAAGVRFIDPVLAEQMMFDKPVPTGQAPHEMLSERELQILILLAKGMGINEIAENIFISNKTVSTHKTHMMRKMNFRNNAEMVRYAAEHGLVD